MAIANQVPRGSKIADVGTDHALLPIFLVQQQQVLSAVATDIAFGPYQAALENVQRYGLENTISVWLGNGLASVAPSEVDVVVIAGMGGSMEAQIIDSAPGVIEHVTRLVLQPMNGVGRLRRYLRERDYSLVHEEVIQEDRYYDLLVAEQSARGSDPYQPFHHDETLLELAYELGPINLQNPTQQSLQYALHQLERWRTVETNLRKSVQAESEGKAQQIERRIQRLVSWIESVQQEGVTDEGAART